MTAISTIPLRENFYNFICQDLSNYNFIQDYGQDGLLLWDPQVPHKLLINPTLRNTLGYTGEECLLNAEEIIPEEDWKTLREYFRAQIIEEETEQIFSLTLLQNSEKKLKVTCRIKLFRKGKDGPSRLFCALNRSDKNAEEKRGYDCGHTITVKKAFVENSLGFLAMLDNKMRFMAVSQACVQKLHLENQNILGKNLYKLFPQITEERKNIHKRCLQGEVIQGDERLFHLNDGTPIWLSWGIRPWYKDNKEIGGLLIRATDITRLKNIEKDLREKENFLHTILDEIDAGVVACDENARLTLFNSTSRKWHGSPENGISSEELSSYYNLYKIDGTRLLKTEEIPLIQALRLGTVKGKEIIIKSENGNARIVSCNGSQLLDAAKNVVGAVVVMNDITVLKREQQRLEFSEKIFKKNFYNAATGMVMLDREGEWFQFNKRLLEITGYTATELKTKAFNDFAHPDEQKDDLTLFQEFVESKSEYSSLEKTFLHKEGHYIHVIVSGSVVKDENNQPLYFLAQIVDVSQQKKSENELKKSLSEVKHLLDISNDQNLRLKNFAHIVSHNLRSHSGNLTMLLNLYVSENPEAAEDEIVTHLISASKNLRETISHLSEVVVMNTSVNNKLEKLTLYDYIERTKENVTVVSKTWEVRIINNVPENLQVLGNPAYLESIILNFLTNGIKYSSEQRKSYIKLSAEKSENYVVLNIQDNGLGIDLQRYRKKLFGMYKTFHNHEDSRGIGLFITKNQIDAMGGKVEIESEVNKGTTFKIYFQHERSLD